MAAHTKSNRDALMALAHKVARHPSNKGLNAEFGHLVANYLVESEHQGWPACQFADLRRIYDLLADINLTFQFGDHLYQELNK